MPPINHLQRISKFYTWADFSTFKAHLMLPKIYLKIIFKNYRNSLSEVPIILPQLLSKFNEYLWSNMQDKTLQQKLYYLSGIPAQHIEENKVPSCKADVLKAYVTIQKGIDKFCGKGRLLYMWSTFQENSLLAASNIAKSAVDKKIKTYMTSMVEFLDETKDFNNKTEKLKKIDDSEVLVIWGRGVEYKTEYTEAQFETLIQRRVIEKKTTIIVSHLAPKDYLKRYGNEIRGTVLEFKDVKLVETLDDILRELEV